VEQRHLVADAAPVEIQYGIVFSFLSVELKEQSSCSVHLVNKSNEYVAFKQLNSVLQMYSGF
jgi:hypothetical protein